MPTEVFAPAKINLTLHVTGRRADGYHLLDSLVVFADVGDLVRVALAPRMSLSVSGPTAAGVPMDAGNLCWQAAEAFGVSAAIDLEKTLPTAAGIGSGSSDAAAVLRGLAQLTGRERDDAGAADPLALGADVPVCLLGRAARMRGIGEDVRPVALPALHAVLANPAVAVPTGQVFARLVTADNPAMSDWPPPEDAAALIGWLAAQRNDLQPAAISTAPSIARVLRALDALPGARLARMSGSGATCFALFDDAAAARSAAQALAAANPRWWIKPCTLA